MKKKIKIYVGCALRHAAQDYKDSVEQMKDTLSLLDGVEILQFVTDPKATPEKIYENDILECLQACDFMVADFSLPSSGLGYEVAVMVEKMNKPVLGFAHRDAVVSGLILGIPKAHFSFQTYSEME